MLFVAKSLFDLIFNIKIVEYDIGSLEKEYTVKHRSISLNDHKLLVFFYRLTDYGRYHFCFNLRVVNFGKRICSTFIHVRVRVAILL